MGFLIVQRRCFNISKSIIPEVQIKVIPHSLVSTYKAISKPGHEKFSFLGVIKQFAVAIFSVFAKYLKTYMCYINI